MKKKLLKLLALLLSAAMLAGCVSPDISNVTNALKEAISTEPVITFQAMEYTRPDMDHLEGTLTDAIQAAAEDDFPALIDLIYCFYDEYDAFYTNYNLADIHYCQDLTDIYWEEEYNYCAQNSARVDAALKSYIMPWLIPPAERSWKHRSISEKAFSSPMTEKITGTLSLFLC